jgi:hypothetical protein
VRVFAVTTTIKSDKGTPVWFPVETDMSLDELYAKLLADGRVIVTRVEGRTERDRYLVTKRRRVMLGKDAVATITDMHRPLVEQNVA